mgnify:CR=1 FL=1
MAIWLCGYVAMFQNPQISKFPKGLKDSQKIISCVQVGVGPISNMLKNYMKIIDSLVEVSLVASYLATR